MNRDLTTGNIRGQIWRFTLPLLGSMLFQQLYNIADSLVAGRFISAEALAAVGNSYEITLIFIAFAFGSNMGSSVVVSQYFGAGRKKEMKCAISTTFIAAFILSIVLTVLGLLFTDLLLEAINTPAELLEMSAEYLDIYILGLLFLFFYNIATGIFTAMGDSRTPFIFLAFSSTANIGVDILFVTLFDMGVAGVAWATFLCQGISSILAVAALIVRLKQIGETKEKAPLFSFHILKQITIIAIPSILQQSFISIGNILVQSVVNSFGAAVMAGYAAAIKLNNMVITSITTIGNGISSFSAQNFGAGKNDRVKEGRKEGLLISIAFSVIASLLFVLLGRYILLLFMKSDETDAIREGIRFLKIVSPFYALISIKLITDAVLRGSGDMLPFMISTFSDLILRVALAFILSWLLASAVGIWLSWPIGWIVGTVISLIFYLSGHWEKRKRLS
ncbi:MAG: MATE family efflux transporter [Spirochaetes bacterium]|uniref:Multidrug-efflux transporter n=1 Tax=Candidatus Ornithospirochaeta stercoripullorum TaxID=2840899 RepID=A0A9D9E2G9_9SPIO|nr:MATE family efflux transporter [Candidatus Ornithospirochaeta stercoripullorum]